MSGSLPKKLAGYIHDTGVRALDHLADNVAPAADGESADALQALVGHWKAMSEADKEDFVRRVADAVGEVIAASALLPAGVAVGKKVVKSARKMMKRGAKAIDRKRSEKPAKRKKDTSDSGAKPRAKTKAKKK